MIKAPVQRRKKVRLEMLCSYIDLLGERDSSENIKSKMISDLKDNYDVLITAMTYPTFLEKAIPIFTRLLSDGIPSFTRITHQKPVQNGILILIDRMPCNDKLKPYAPVLVDTLMCVIKHDNQDNAAIALRVIHNIYARITPSFDHQVVHILDLIRAFLARVPAMYPQMVMPIDETVAKYASSTARLEYLKAQTHYVECHISMKEADKGIVEVAILPEAQRSLRVFQDMLRLALQLAQLYGRQVHGRIDQLIRELVGLVTLASFQSRPTLLNLKALREVTRMQARALAFLGVLLATHLDAVAAFQPALTVAAVDMLIQVPPRCADLRRELLGALRLFATPLTAHWLVPALPKLCCERALIGGGYTSQQTLRPLAYGFLGRLVLNPAVGLNVTALNAAVKMFVGSLVDTTLPHRVMVISCQVLAALVPPVALGGQYDLLDFILRAIVQRFKMIAKTAMPKILCAKASEVTIAPAEPRSEEDLGERRALIGLLATGFKAVTSANPPCIGFQGCEAAPGDLKVTLSGIKWAVRALSVFSEGETADAAWKAQGSEITERLVSVIGNVSILAQKLTTATAVDHVMFALPKNKRAASLVGRMLTASGVAADTAVAVMEFLNAHVGLIGEREKVTAAQLLLEQLCSCSCDESCDGVAQRLLEFIRRVICVLYETKDPLPFVTALHSMFRVLEHRDVPQIEPVVTELVTCLVGACHTPLKKQQRKMMLETTLMIPIKLTAVLPLMPLLMDAVVMAMNEPDSETASMGLSVLRLMLDRMDRRFLLAETRRHRVALRSALGALARSACAETRAAAMRLVGSLGTDVAGETGSLPWREADEDVTIQTTFLGCPNVVHLPVNEMVEAAVEMLVDSTTDTFLQNHSWEVVRSFIVASIQFDEDKSALHRLFTHPSFTDASVEITLPTQPQYKMPNSTVRDVHVKALSGILLAGAREDIRSRALKMIMFLSSYYTLVAVAQQAGPCPLPEHAVAGRGVDSLTYVDAIILVLGLGETALVKPALLALMFVIKAAAAIVGSKYRARHLSLLEYARMRVAAMCYDRAAQRGACVAIKCMVEHMEVAWNCANVAGFTCCLMHVVRDSAGRIAHGVKDRARAVLDKLVATVTEKPTPPPAGEELAEADAVAAQAHGVEEMARELAHSVVDIDPGVRHTAMHLLSELASRSDTSLRDLLAPHQRVLAERVLPKRGVLHQFSVDDQLAALEATAFCLAVTPKLYEIDPGQKAHKEFLEEVFFLCRSEEGSISSEREVYSVMEEAWESANRWGPEGWVKVRQAAAKLLSNLHYLVDSRHRIILAFIALVKSNNPEIQDTGYECLLTFRAGFDITPLRNLIAIEIMSSLEYLNTTTDKTTPSTEDTETRTEADPTDGIEGPRSEPSGKTNATASSEGGGSDGESLDFGYLTQTSEPSTSRLRTTVLLVRLFPEVSRLMSRQFARLVIDAQLVPGNPRVTASELTARRRHVANAAASAAAAAAGGTGPAVSSDDLESWLYLFCYAAHARQPAFVGGPSFLRELLVTLVIANPAAAVAHLLADEALLDESLSSLLAHVLRRDDGQPVRDRIQESCGARLLELLGDPAHFPDDKPRELRYQAVRVIHLLARRDPVWLTGNCPLIATLRAMWRTETFHTLHSSLGTMPPHHWNCPRLVAQVLLRNFAHNLADFQHGFELVRGLCTRFIADFSWLPAWLEASVAGRASSYRRLLFFAFTETLASVERSRRHQAAVLAHMVVPNLRAALRDSMEVLGKPTWDGERMDPTNIASVFAHHILELSASMDDFLRVEILKLGILLVDRATEHVHNIQAATSAAAERLAGKRRPCPDILHKIVTYAWHCHSEHVTSDPLVKHTGYLLLATVISKLPMRHRILQQVLQGLLRSDGPEVRTMTLQSLDLVTPQVGRISDGYSMLHGWMMDIVQDCDNGGEQTTLLLQTIVRCHWVYYNMIPLGLVEFLTAQVRVLGARTASNHQRRLALDVIDVLLQWAERCTTESKMAPATLEEADSAVSSEAEPDLDLSSPGPSTSSGPGLIRSSTSSEPDKLPGPRPPAPVTPSGPIAARPSDSSGPIISSGSTGLPEPGKPAGSRASGPGKLCRARSCGPGGLPKTGKGPGKLHRAVSCGSAEPGKAVGPWPCGLGNPSDYVTRFQPAFFLGQLVGIGSVSSEGPDREVLRQATDRCVKLIDTVFNQKMTPDTGSLKIEWLFSLLLDSRSSECQATVLKLLACLGRHMPRWQAGALARQLQTSALDKLHRETYVVTQAQKLAVALISAHPGDPAAEAVDPEKEAMDSLLYQVITKGISTTALEDGGALEPLIATVGTLESLVKSSPALADRFGCHLGQAVTDLSCLEADVDFELAGAVSEVLAKLLLLVDARSVPLGASFRKQFLGSVLVDVIHQTRHAVVLDVIITLVNDGLTKKSGLTGPEFPDMLNLLVQIAPNISARFAENVPLQERYLLIVHFVYKEKALRPTDQCGALLAPAVTLGLRCAAYETRAKFVALLDAGVRRRVDKRLVHSANAAVWRSLDHWTPYALDLVFSIITTASHNNTVQHYITVSNPEHKLLSATGIAQLSGHTLADLCPLLAEAKIPSQESTLLRKELRSVAQSLESVQDVRSATLLHAAAQLCYARPPLARSVWLQVFPRLWPTLSWDQQQAQICCLGTQMSESLSAEHAVAEPTGDSIFLEALIRCSPRPEIHWGLVQYCGKYHNLWHSMALALEKMAPSWMKEIDGSNNQNIETGLVRYYAALSERDLMCAVMRDRAAASAGKEALALWRLGEVEAAREAALVAVDEVRTSPAPEDSVEMLDALGKLWIDCTRELGQWEALREAADVASCSDIETIAECAWSLNDLDELAAVLPELVESSSRDIWWKYYLYCGYLELFGGESNHDGVDGYVRLARDACILDWQRLPAAHCAMHVPVMQAAQLILELEESNRLLLDLARWHRHPNANAIETCMRSAVWRWEERAGNAVDCLAHLSARGTQRRACYEAIARLYQGRGDAGQRVAEIAAAAYENSAIDVARAARKRGMPRVCVEMLQPDDADNADNAENADVDSTDVDDRDTGAEVSWPRMRQLIKAACQLPAAETDGTWLDPAALVHELDLGRVPAPSLPDALLVCADALRQRSPPDALAWLARARAGAGASWDDADSVCAGGKICGGGKTCTGRGNSCKSCAVSYSTRGDGSNYSSGKTCPGTDVICDGCRSCVNSEVTCAGGKAGVGVDTKCTRYQSGTAAMTESTCASKTCDCEMCRGAGGRCDGLESCAGSRSCAGFKRSAGSGKAWARWAEHLEREAPADCQRAGQILRCWLAAESEAGAGRRRILAKVIWLVQVFDDDKSTLALEAEEAQGVRLAHWLPWVPQILEVFASSGGAAFFQLLLKLGGRYPQPLYFSVRTLYITQKASNELARLANPQEVSSKEMARRTNVLLQSSRLLASILRIHPSVVSPLEVTLSELMLLRDSWAESCVRDLRRVRQRSLVEAFARLDDVVGATASPELTAFINTRMVNRGFKETLLHRAQNSWMKSVKSRLADDFEKVCSSSGGVRLAQLPIVVDRWLKILVPKCENSDPMMINDKCRYISSFTGFTAVMGMFDEDFSVDVPSHRRVLVHGFLPLVETSRGRRWIRVRGSDGAVRTFRLLTDADTAALHRRGRLLQLLPLLNEDLDRDRETCRRGLRFDFPRVASVSRDMQLVAVTPAAVSSLQVYQQTGGRLADQCVTEFYQQLARLQASSPGTLPDHAQRHAYYARIKARWTDAPLVDWARMTYPDPVHYWAFRKTLTASLALLLTAEHVLHLTRLNAASLFIDRATGRVHADALTFDVEQLTLAASQSRPVAFRLTECMARLLGRRQIDGPLMLNMIAAGRCLARSTASMPDLLQAVLAEEAPAEAKTEAGAWRRCTAKWVAAAVGRAAAMADSDSDASVESLIEGARCRDNLSQMDPSWLPWL